MRKTTTFKFRLSEHELKIIQRKAELLDISVAEYLRQAALNKQVKGFKMSDILNPEQQVKGQLELADLL